MRKRTRLTITLPNELLKRVDTLVDGSIIRNRSHAVEKILSDGLSPAVSQAVILAGGKSAKRRSLLSLINGQHLLQIVLGQLKTHGILECIICTDHDFIAELQKRFGDGRELGCQITYMPEVESLGTAGALRNCAHLLNQAPFLVLHGDVLTSINISEFIQFHLNEQKLATIGVKPRLGERSFGQVFLQGNSIIKFLERGTDQGISIVNTGLYVLDPSVIGMIPKRKPVFLESDVFPTLAKQGQLSAFIFQGLWYDITSPSLLEEAARRWLQ